MIIPNGREISFARIRAGMSMRELGRQAGLNIGTISKIESKSSPVSPKTAKQICDVLQISFDDVFTVKLNDTPLQSSPQ